MGKELNPTESLLHSTGYCTLASRDYLFKIQVFPGVFWELPAELFLPRGSLEVGVLLLLSALTLSSLDPQG